MTAPTRPRRARAALLSAALLLGFPVAGQAQTLTMGVRAGPDSIDPHWSTLGSHIEALRHVFDSLVGVDENLNLVPGLATSWRVVDDTTWEFKLRPGVKFHDGSELTAEDIKFSFERIPVVTGPMTMTLYTKQAKEAVVVDPLTVRFVTHKPAPTLPNDFTRLMIVNRKIGADARNEQFNAGTAAIGTGPYRFVAWEPKGDLVLERFDGYWGTKPHWARVLRKEIPNDAARLAALKSGQVDLINYVPATDHASLQRDQNLETVVGESVYIFNIAFNLRSPLPKPAKVDGQAIEKNPFQDAKVREAMDLAIDRRALARVVYEGLATPANQLMTPSFFGGVKDLPDRRSDLPRARALLAEAGYPKGFEVDFHCTNNRLPGDGALCEALTQQWARIGLKVNANALNGTVFFPASTRNEFSLQMSGWGTLTGEASYTYAALLHTADPSIGLGGFNRSGYSNPTVDRLLREGISTLDEEKRRAMFEEATRITMAERPMLPVLSLQTIWAARKGALTFKPRIDQETLAYAIRPRG